MKKSKNSLFINMGSYALLQVVNLLVGVFLPRLYLLTYGSEVNGIISTINSFTSYFSYLEAGLGLTLIHSLFKPLVSQNYDEINGILSFSKKKYQKISLLYFILVVLLSLIFPFIQHANDISSIEFVLLVLVIGSYGAFDFYAMAKYRVLLTADKKEYVISNAMMLAQLLRFIFVFVALQFKISVVVVKIVPILTLFVRTIILKVYIKKHYKEVNYKVKPLMNLETVSQRGDALLLQIAISTSTSLPTILISLFLGYKEANVFAVYSLVTTAIIAIVSALSSGVSPMFGCDMALGKNIKPLYNMYSYIVTYIITVLFSVMAIMIIPFVNLYVESVEDINYIYPIYGLLFSIWGALHSYRIPLTAIINASAMYKKNRINNIVNLLLQIIGGCIGVYYGGIMGLLIAIIIATFQRNVAFCYVNSKNVVHDNIFQSIINQVLMISIIIASSYIGSILNIYDIDIAHWILFAFISTICEFLVCLVIFTIFNYKEIYNIINYIKDRK